MQNLSGGKLSIGKLSIGKIVALLLGSAIALAAGYWGCQDFLNAPAPNSWEKADGKITRVWVDTRKSNRNLSAEYEYMVAGKNYSSRMYSFNQYEFPYDTQANSEVDVYYQPDKPELAVLDRRKPTAKAFTALMLIGLLAFGIIAGVFAPDPPWMRPNRWQRPGPPEGAGS